MFKRAYSRKKNYPITTKQLPFSRIKEGLRITSDGDVDLIFRVCHMHVLGALFAILLKE